MRVKYFYPWGYSYPVTYGADRVAANHLEYFRARGWEVDCILPEHPAKAKWAAEFRREYAWLRSLSLVEYFPPPTGLRDTLFSYRWLARSPRMRAALEGPADLFFTNYVFTCPLLEHVPASCRKVMESHDLMTRQYTLADRLARGGKGTAPGAVERARDSYLLRTELDLYRLFDAAIMINPDELRLVQSHGVTHAAYVPQMYEPSAAGPARPAADREFDLIFVGSDVIPNVQGLSWFYRHVYVPYLWRHKVRLAVVGGVCKRLSFPDSHVTCFSWVNGALDELYASARLTVVPIFEGTGMAIKTLEALALGRAIVTTPVGARGLDDQANAYLKIDMKADPRLTAEVILDLLARPARRQELEHAAAAYVRRCFSREAFFAAMDRVLKVAGIDPAPHADRATEAASVARPMRHYSAWSASGGLPAAARSH